MSKDTLCLECGRWLSLDVRDNNSANYCSRCSQFFCDRCYRFHDCDVRASLVNAKQEPWNNSRKRRR